MNQRQLRQLILLSNMVELNKRVLKNLVGNELSTKVDGQDVGENAEALVVTKLRERLPLKAK